MDPDTRSESRFSIRAWLSFARRASFGERQQEKYAFGLIYWRKRVGVEPTDDTERCRPPVLKTGVITGLRALPLPVALGPQPADETDKPRGPKWNGKAELKLDRKSHSAVAVKSCVFILKSRSDLLEFLHCIFQKSLPFDFRKAFFLTL
jgi:hypothetical protein